MAVTQPVLIMIQGPEPGSIYKLPDNRVISIGRSSRNTIRTVSSSVSRFHCEIGWVNGRWELTDLNSRQGTMLNGVRVRDKTALQPGDIIRLSTTVFRFDAIDETALDAGALVAIKEAALDVKLRTKDQIVASLEGIRARSRLDGESVRQGRVGKRRTLRVNLAFLGMVAGAVCICAAAVLFYAHGRAAQAHAGNEPRAVQPGLPGAQAARDAAAKQAEAVWSAVQQKLSEVARREAEGDYADAFRLYGELEGPARDDAVSDLIGRRKQYTVRLARASFRTIEQTARRHVEDGDLEAALRLYRRASDRIGVPELAAQAQARVSELQSRASK